MVKKQSQSVNSICLTPVKKRAHESPLWSKVTTGWGEEEGATEDIFLKQPVRQSCHGNLAFARVEMEGEGKGREEHGEGEVPIQMMR